MQQIKINCGTNKYPMMIFIDMTSNFTWLLTLSLFSITLSSPWYHTYSNLFVSIMFYVAKLRKFSCFLLRRGETGQAPSCVLIGYMIYRESTEACAQKTNVGYFPLFWQGTVCKIWVHRMRYKNRSSLHFSREIVKAAFLTYDLAYRPH